MRGKGMPEGNAKGKNEMNSLKNASLLDNALTEFAPFVLLLDPVIGFLHAGAQINFRLPAQHTLDLGIV